VNQRTQRRESDRGRIPGCRLHAREDRARANERINKQRSSSDFTFRLHSSEPGKHLTSVMDGHGRTKRMVTASKHYHSIIGRSNSRLSEQPVILLARCITKILSFKMYLVTRCDTTCGPPCGATSTPRRRCNMCKVTCDFQRGEKDDRENQEYHHHSYKKKF
jgi:hypothetical protein